MDIFKTFSLTWWQTGIFKVGLLAAGVAIGACWSNVFASYIPLLVAIAAISLAYVLFIWIRQ